MFGYVKPDLPYLYLKDDRLYKALYCGVCKSIGKNFGQRARLGLTYDIAFLSAFAHNLKGADVEIKKERCVAHHLVPRFMASRDEITEVCAAVNVALVYYKIKDDINDRGRGRVKLAFFKRAWKKTLKKYSAVSEIVERNYDNLRALERACESRIDAVGDCFGNMMRELGEYVLGDASDKNSSDTFYFLGKWIYLIDALDDYEKDGKRGEYNPFRYAFGEYKTLSELLKNHGQEITYIFGGVFAGLKNSSENLKWKFNHDLIINVLTKGVEAVTLGVFKKTQKENKKSNGEER
ncbi:MAG: hypothetical protein IJS67_05015 [Clostridia bacterium]|nr:hypothetical protein [Clostridia bacterium]